MRKPNRHYIPARQRRRRHPVEAPGMDEAEQQMLRMALVNVAFGLNERQLKMASDNLHHFIQNRAIILDVLPEDVPGADAATFPEEMRCLAVAFEDRAQAANENEGDFTTDTSRSALSRRLSLLADLIGLDAVEETILQLVARIDTFATWSALLTALPFNSNTANAEVIALFSGLCASEIDSRLGRDCLLINSGMILPDGDGEYQASPLLQRVTRSLWDDTQTLRANLLPPAPPSTLSAPDFEHLGEAAKLAAHLIASGEPVSILLHGLPGTGKSEFARHLADLSARHAVFAGLVDRRGGEPDRSDRMSHLALLRILGAGESRTLIVVDEADDVLHVPMRDSESGSKLWRNRMVEDPRVPTVWILNDPALLDPALIRRMNLAIGFDTPPVRVRERVVQRSAAALRMEVSEAEAQRLARIETEPALLAQGLRTAKLTTGKAQTAEDAITGILKAMGRHKPPTPPASAVYHPAYARADTDLAALAQRLCDAPHKGWSLLLSGPSGTGKSAYARHLAQRMDMPLEDVRGSDLLGPFVGQTEANIARVFMRAHDRGALLLIDEADSFLFARDGGQRSWERGMVNEMLRWMECLETPMVATTNLATALDPATQRRFTLRASFQAMSQDQANALFAAHFGMAPPTGTPPLEGQTPGDFAVVARRAQLLGETRGKTLVTWLCEEATLRGERSGKVGF
ncbi:AAA family ATPase [Novosphingobium decolorationis]|uniref:ATP-binding protein n=1 Tax=Novosphingobium decolorationis TaxID=2698673 RepID=A0ABX8EAW8_9SPHN|nr:AAA family ATPase [Novosphingobium decolorationis]QVM85176.1 ATP-binding protein [Novosphingobium decolorationis]